MIGGDKAFEPSIIDLDEEENRDEFVTGIPEPTFQEKLAKLFNRMRITRFFRTEAKKAKERREGNRNPAGAKLIRRYAKAATGTRMTYKQALRHYNRLVEPELRAGASRFERARAQQQRKEAA
jgi:hypothetical protein